MIDDGLLFFMAAIVGLMALIGICSGCTPRTGKYLNQTLAVGEFHYISASPDCDKKLSEALTLWATHGYRARVSKDAAKTLLCVAARPLWVKLLWPFGVGGVANDRVAWAEPNFLWHEMGHLVWGLEHGKILRPVSF